MLTEILTSDPNEITAPVSIWELGTAANQAAAASEFSEYRARKAAETIRRQDAGLRLFASFLRSIGAEVDDLNTDPAAWTGITWGLVKAFRNWMLKSGHAVKSANVRLSTVKTYAKLATKAGAISPQEYSLIAAVDGFAHKETSRIDQQRQDAGIPVRSGNKKATAARISARIANSLKNPEDLSPQAKRDAALMSVLIDHGLRVSEVAGLTVSNVNLETEEIIFYRPKVDNTGRHKLSRDALENLRDYMTEISSDPGAPLFVGSTKTGQLTDQAMSARAINKRVSYLGQRAGIASLSPHDCRHYAATRIAKSKTIDQLMSIFGWSSPAMAIRYIEAEQVSEVE